ncbi:MAG: transcriptional repressor LexA [Oscillospiraceae bacterium]|nr:transcriptional repressor LexA [Oscillospiraceae bacterium]MCI8877434.1 transcriptional repressor LexA [Oscillospiraceae bacterium]
MPKKTQMTERIYEYLQEVIPAQGYAPSVREICAAVGLRSPSTVHFHLKRLQEQGLIEKGDFKGRAIVLTQPKKKHQVPIVGDVAAGSPILAQECIDDYLTFDCGGEEDCHFALRVRGESMLNAGILPGDLAVVRRQQTARSGDIVVALLEDEATVKRLSLRNGQVWLLPENDDYEPIDGNEAVVLGKVVAVVRTY